MKKMVENSTINEIIKGISALIGGAFGVKILDFFIQRRKKKEEKNKEVLISSLMSINTMDSYMEKVTKETPVDRFLILVGHDSGNIPNPMHPYYSKVLWQNLKNKNVKDNETLIRKFDAVKVDVPYISMIIEMLMVGSVKLKVSEMQDCFLKRVYIDEGIKYSEVYFLKHEKADHIYYCSISTTKENEFFQSPKDRMVIELAVNHIETIFREIN